MTIRPGKRSFAAGEVDPDIAPRSDLVANQNGLARCRNFVVRPQGGVERRPGTEYVCDAKFADRTARLGPFRRSAADALVVEWGDGYARFVQDGAQIMSGGTPLEIATIYGTADLPRLQWTQSGDVLWVASGKRLKELQRTAKSPAAFQLVDAVIRNGPFKDRNSDDSLTITASAETGTVTLTASAALFNPDHVGAFWRLDEVDWSETARWEPQKVYVLWDRVRYDGNVYECTSDGRSGSPPIHLEGEQSDGGGTNPENGSRGDPVTWKYLHSGYGIVKITAYTSATQVTAEVQGVGAGKNARLPGQVTTGTWKWQEGAWSDHRGWPRAVALWQQSLWAANTDDLPFWIWKSAIQGFDDFEDGDLDDQALRRGLFDGATDEIRWMAPGYVMVIGTGGPEWVAKPAQTESSVTPSTLETRSTTDEGACDVPAITIGNRVLFIDGTARTLRAHGYEFSADRYETTDLSLLAAHILGPGVVQIAWANKPSRVLWCLLRDGKVAGFTYHREQEIFAWHLHDFGDPVESIATVPAENGEVDELYLLVKRERGGVADRVIERMRKPYDAPAGDTIEDAWYLDSAVQATGSDLTSVSGLDHLEGRNVVALCDGKQHPGEMTVSGGKVDLDFPADKVIVGLPFASTIRTLPFDMGLRDEWQRGRVKSLSRLVLAVRDALGGTVAVNGKRERIDRLGARPVDAAPELFTGLKEVRPPAGAAAEVHVEIEYDRPYPASITGIFPEYEV